MLKANASSLGLIRCSHQRTMRNQSRNNYMSISKFKLFS